MSKKTNKNKVKTETKNNLSDKGKGNSYTAKDIYVLEGLEPVRKRPGMYIGSTGPDGLHHLVWEVVDNSIDEAMGGFAKNITIELLPDNQVSVTDDGRGIPVEVHHQTKKSTLETVLTTLHAGGKFGGESYKVSGGLHGVGVSVVNALSEWLRVEVCREGELWMQEYERGKARSKVKKIGKCGQTGTKVIFSPDPQIFSEIVFSDKRILDHIRQQSYLTKGIRINFFDKRKSPLSFHGFYFEGGVLSFVKYLAAGEKLLQDEIFYVHKENNPSKTGSPQSDSFDTTQDKSGQADKEKMEVEVAFAYVDDFNTKELSFANNIYTPDGGMHLTGFRSALTRTLNNYARSEGYLKEKEENLTADDVREGLVTVISVRLREPQFEGQTKARLGNPEARTVVEAVVNEALKEFLEKRPGEARKMIEKVILAAKARLAAKAAKDTVLRKGALDGLTLPGKLADCSSRNPEESEIFIVEGDSAGGCFSGDTKVALTDGRNLSLKELVEENKKGIKNYCYTVDKNHSIKIAEVLNPRLTKKNTRVIKIILDNDEEIVCTPDHKFMLAEGIYKEAQHLTSADSLMPLYRKFSEVGGKITISGYEMVFDPSQNYWIFTHLLADRFNLERAVYLENNGPHRHHKNFNKRNNNPDNIIRLTKEEHLEIHRRLAEKTLRRPEVLEKLKAIRQTPEFRNKVSKKMLSMRNLLSARAKKQWENQEYKKYMISKFMEFYSSNSEYREKNNELLKTVQKEYWNKAKNRKKQAERVKNYFATNPEKRKELSTLAKKQWQNIELKNWRKNKTKEQWTADFRERRLNAYNATYRQKVIRALRGIYEQKGDLDIQEYEKTRRDTNNKNLLRYDTILERFFNGDQNRLREAVINFNHKIKKIVKLDEIIDVYDFEVPSTHNFALASGVFVHNSAKAGRDRRTQAILPVKGKILNVEKARLDKMLANQEIRSLVVAMGTAIADNFDLTKLRYHKIVLMSDADVDGAHIRTLFLTLFYRYFPQIIEGGYLYIAQPPLYRMQSGKDVRYAFSDAEKDKTIAEMQKQKTAKGKSQIAKGKSRAEEVTEEDVAQEWEPGEEKKIPGIAIQRYKGLGEMNPEQLWETTMNPENRILRLVEVGDAEKADKLFGILMGDMVEPRKQFIQAYAAEVQNLDI